MPRFGVCLADAKWRRAVADVVAYGNSQGAGVATIGRGKIIGLAVDRFETDAEIVPGNSGGPVVDANRNVIGIATYGQLLARDGE